MTPNTPRIPKGCLGGLIAVIMLPTLVILAIFCPQALRIDTIWYREYVANRIQALAQDVKTNPQDVDSLDELIRTAQSTFSFERDYAIGTIGKLGDKAEAAVPMIIDGLSSSDSGTRWAATRALSDMGKTAAPAKAELIRVLNDYPTQSAGTTAAEALGNIGDSSPEVLYALRVAAKNSDDSSTVYEAHKAYEQLTGHPLDD